MEKIERAYQRRLIVELYLDIHAEVVRRFLPMNTRRIGGTMVLVLGEVILGHIRWDGTTGDGTTASAVARSLNLPRATAVRRLRELEKLGAIKRTSGGRYCVIPAQFNSPDGMVLHERLVRRIKEVAKNL